MVVSDEKVALPLFFIWAKPVLNFKNKIVEITEGQTQLSMKSVVPVRLIKNEFYQKIAEAEQRGALRQELIEILGRARAKKGMFEGDLDEGELEIGQGVTGIRKIMPAAEIVREIWTEYQQTKKQLCES